MLSTTTYDRGQIVVVNVPFTGQAGAKLRPALVVSTRAFHKALPDIIVCPVSSQPRFFLRPGAGDHPLKHWRVSGLKHPSTARISNVLAVEKKLVKRVLGAIHPDDLKDVAQGLRAALGL